MRSKQPRRYGRATVPSRPDFDKRHPLTDSPRVVIRATKRSLGGRRFEPVAERRLLPAARRAIALLAERYGEPIVVSEAHGPFGVPDLLVALGGTEWFTTRRASGLPPLLNEIDARIVAHASSTRGYAPVSLARRASLDTYSVTRRLPHLVKAGHLQRGGPTSFRRHAALDTPNRLYAVELKLREWRKAVAQGRRYALWADTYLAVLGTVSSPGNVELLNEIHKDGAGLMLDGEMILMPSRLQPDKGRRLLAAEYLAAARI
jgi:hypothetical protein